MTSMGIIRNFSAKHSRHHHSLFKESSKSDDIASLLGLPGIEDAHKLWNLTSHAKESMIKEVLCPRSLLAEDNNLCREQKSRFHGSLHLPFTLESNCAKMTSFLDFFSSIKNPWISGSNQTLFIAIPRGIYPHLATPSQKKARGYLESTVEKEKWKLFCSGQKVSQSLKLALL